MKAPHILSLGLAFGLLACGGSPVEELADQQADLFNQMAGLLESIETPEDLHERWEDLRVVANQLKELMLKWQEIQQSELSDEDAETVEKGNKRMAEATTRYGTALTSLFANPELGAEMAEMMNEFGDFSGR